MKLDFISQPSSKSTLPLAGLQHMQQCQLGWNIPLSILFWSKCMVPENGLLSRGLNPRPLSHEFSALTMGTTATCLLPFISLFSNKTEKKKKCLKLATSIAMIHSICISQKITLQISYWKWNVSFLFFHFLSKS